MIKPIRISCEKLGYRRFKPDNLVVLEELITPKPTDLHRQLGTHPKSYLLKEYGIVTEISPWHVPEGSSYVAMVNFGKPYAFKGVGNWASGFRKASLFERLFYKNKFPSPQESL